MGRTVSQGTSRVFTWDCTVRSLVLNQWRPRIPGRPGHMTKPNPPEWLSHMHISSPLSHSRASRRPDQGFSLVELLIVLAIIMTIAAFAIPNLVSAIDESKIARAVGDMNAIEIDITEYQISNGTLPNTLADVGRAALVDPWGNPYQYFNHLTSTGNGVAREDRFLVLLNSDYDLTSMGKDRQTAPALTATTGLDDIVRAGNGAYLGLASQY